MAATSGKLSSVTVDTAPVELPARHGAGPDGTEQGMPTINDMSFRIAGAAGQGVESSGAGFAQALAQGGLHVFALQDYMSRIRGGLNWVDLRESLYETVRISCMLAWLFFAAQTIIGGYTLAGGTTFVQNALTAMELGPWGTVIFMQVIWVFLGCFLDWVGILFLTVPLFLPIVLKMGFDNVWFGVVFCMNMHISYLSPPFGPSVFYLKSVAPSRFTTTQIYRSIMPYLWWTFVATGVITAWPSLSLWLPGLLLRR